MSRGEHYGKLNWVNLPSEVKRIWSTRNHELEELPSWRWSWEHEEPAGERAERADLVRKLLTATPLTAREGEAIELLILRDHTLEDVAAMWGVTRERVRQVQGRALRRLRWHAKTLQGLPAGDIDPSVTTWQAWRWTLREQRSRARPASMTH